MEKVYPFPGCKMIKLLKFDKYSRHYDIILAKSSIVVRSDDGYYVFPPKIFAKSECEEPMSSDSRVPFYVFVKGAYRHMLLRLS